MNVSLARDEEDQSTTHSPALNQQIGEVPRLQFDLGNVPIIPSDSPDLLSSLLELDISSGLFQRQGDYDEKDSVLDHLDPFLPPWSERFVYKSSVDGRGDGTEDGNVGEECGRDCTVDGFPDVTEGSSDLYTITIELKEEQLFVRSALCLRESSRHYRTSPRSHVRSKLVRCCSDFQLDKRLSDQPVGSEPRLTFRASSKKVRTKNI